MYSIISLLVLCVFFIILSLIYNLYFLLKIRKIRKIRNSTIFINNKIKKFLIVFNLILSIFSIISIALDIIILKVSMTLIYTKIVAYLLVITNLAFFIISTIGYWILYKIYESFILIKSDNRLTSIFFDLKLSNINCIKKHKKKSIIILYGKYNDIIRIKTMNSINANKLLKFVGI